MRAASFFHLPVIVQGFRSVVTTSWRHPKFLPTGSKLYTAPLNENIDFDKEPPAMVAAASAATLCTISGDDPVLKTWCEKAMKSEIPQFFEGESEYATVSYSEMDEDELVYKDALPYTEEMVRHLDYDINGVGDEEEDELCIIDEAFDISKSTSATDTTTTFRKRMLRPKKRKHVFRYSPDISVSCWLSTVKPEELLLSSGYSTDSIERMVKEYPKLLSLDAKNLIAPKLRFLVNVLGGGTGDIGNGIVSELQQQSGEVDFVPHNLYVSEFARGVPTHAFFNPRLETTIAPRHAYLAFHGDSLPFGKELLELQSNDDISTSDTMPLLIEFLDACTKSPAEFAALCQKWETNNVANRSTGDPLKKHTEETVMAMDNIFSDGIVPFARNRIPSDLSKLGKRCTPACAVALLLDHGANYAEHDDWGSTALHWTAGTGNFEAMKVLIEKLEKDEQAFGGDIRDVLWSTCASCSITRDGATPLHWAACGVSSTHFGCGGHEDVCRFLLDKAGERRQSLANAVTSSGNSPLMWACWSGSIDVVRLLVSAGADPRMSNDNGLNVAHWAASSGNLDVCKYLHDELAVEFQGSDAKDKDGKTPSDVAFSFGHADVIEWIASLTYELKDDRARVTGQAAGVAT